MSIRLGLSGFQLEKLQSLLSDPTALRKAEAKAKAARKAGKGALAQVDEETFAAGLTVLEAVAQYGVPVPGLEAESVAHAVLGLILAHHDQNHRQTNCDLKMVPLEDFRDQYGKLLSPTGRELFNHLVDGRPLFAPRFEPDAMLVYGYLSRAEAAKLASAFGRFLEKEWHSKGDWDEDDVEEMVSDMIEWLESLSEKKLDVWAFHV
jgi:hypothetical protein